MQRLEIDVWTFKKKNEPRVLWSIIDEKAENLGLNFEDWSILKHIINEINTYKHPDPIWTKEQAYTKIEKLKGTDYSNCYEPLKNLVNLFEKNKWKWLFCLCSI